MSASPVPDATAEQPPAGWLRGPNRAVAVLSITQILGWGALVYPPVLTMPRVAAELGWSLASCMAGFSLALVVSGLLSPAVGGLIDRYGGHVVMSAGAGAGAAGLLLLAVANGRLGYFASWMLIGAAMPAALYDASFSSLTRIFGGNAQRAITFVTFAGGFASTIAWPGTQLLIESIGWRGCYVVFAAVFAFVILPLHALGLPRTRATSAQLAPASAETAAAMPPRLQPRGAIFALLAAGFALQCFILSGVTSNLLAMLERGGLSAAAAVAIGALFGPAQFTSRLLDFTLARRTQPLWIARAAMALMALAFVVLVTSAVSFAAAAAFMLAFGAANGVMTIVRGALPLQLFGPLGYGRVMGRLARPVQFMQASAPFLVASATELFSDRVVLMLAMIGAAAASAFFFAIKPARA